VLTADLVQVSVGRTHVRPRYIRTDDDRSLDLAATLIAIFESTIGRTRGALKGELADHLGTGTEFQLHRGLAKLLEDRCEFETRADVDPVELRRVVFEAAAAEYRRESTEEATTFDRATVLQSAAATLELDAEAVDAALFADLKDEQVLKEFERPSTEWLLERYNVALAQAVLLRATVLEVEVRAQSPARYRELFRKMKFLRLLYEVEGSAEEGYRIRLDGPMSLFKSSQRYGLQMALFLPAVLHCDEWRVEATVRWGKKRRELSFSLGLKDGLKPHTISRGQWQPDEVAWLVTQFAKVKSDWTLSDDTELIDLGRQGILIPDYVFTHEPTGKRVYMEILGFWRRGAVESRLKILREQGPENLILAISKELAVDDDDLEDLPGEVYVFRSAPVAREVAKLLKAWE